MSLFEFDDYRPFLRKHIEDLPRKGRGEINRMAHSLRVNATLVSQVLSGKKSFTVEQAHQLAQHLALEPLATEYLLLLVQTERAGTVDLQNYWKQKRQELKIRAAHLGNRLERERVLTAEESALFYSSWIYSAVRLFCSIGDGKTAGEVAERFGLAAPRTGDILRFLVQTGLVIEESGRFQIGPQRTHLEAGSAHLPRHHANWRLKAIQYSENLQPDELLFTGPISISKKDFESTREEIVALIKRLSERVKDSTPENVACFEVGLIWVR